VDEKPAAETHFIEDPRAGLHVSYTSGRRRVWLLHKYSTCKFIPDIPLFFILST
jgi:hypothetical protein